MTKRTIYPKPDKPVRPLPNRRWEVHYSQLICDGGGTSSWSNRYRTCIGARIAAWWYYNIRTWGGGSVTLIDRWENV